MRPGLFLDPRTKGMLLAIVSIAGITLCIFFLLSTMPPPSPTLLRSLAAVSASFVLAYAIEATWLVTQVEISDEYEELLGFITGIGGAGLLAIPISLLLAEHRAAGHSNFLDDLGLGWTFAALTILGGLVVLQPVLADNFRERDEAS